MYILCYIFVGICWIFTGLCILLVLIKIYDFIKNNDIKTIFATILGILLFIIVISISDILGFLWVGYRG